MDHYADDARILAVLVFGSLGRGTWDCHSDLDLDIVIADGVEIDVPRELERLCGCFSPIGEKVALIIPDGDDAGDVVLESLMQLSIRYHPPAATSPNILDSMRVLAGRIDPAAIQAAGRADRGRHEKPLSQLLDTCVRYAAVADVSLQRQRFWATVEVLHRMRGLLMELVARSRGRARAWQVFDEEADAKLQAELGAALPQYDLASLQQSLLRLLHILEYDLGPLASGQLRLTGSHRLLLDRIRQRQARVQFDNS